MLLSLLFVFYLDFVLPCFSFFFSFCFHCFSYLFLVFSLFFFCGNWPFLLKVGVWRFLLGWRLALCSPGWGWAFLIQGVRIGPSFLGLWVGLSFSGCESALRLSSKGVLGWRLGLPCRVGVSLSFSGWTGVCPAFSGLGFCPCPSFLSWWLPLPSCCGGSPSLFWGGGWPAHLSSGVGFLGLVVGPFFLGCVWPVLLVVGVGVSFSGSPFLLGVRAGPSNNKKKKKHEKMNRK